MYRGIASSIAAVVLLGLISCAQSVSLDQAGQRSGSLTAMADPSFNPGEGWSLVWSDEFEGTALDSTKWSAETGDGSSHGLAGWGNRELEYYRPENAVVSGGNLSIQVKREAFGGKEFTSARLTTQGKFEAHYGKIAARIKAPGGKGIWPAFWMLGRDFDYNNWPGVGEIDIMELKGGQDGDMGDRVLYGTLHWWNNSSYAMYGTTYTNATKLTDDFHVYELEWNSNFIYIKVDGTTYYTMDFFYSNPKSVNAFQFPFFIIMNCAVGGTFFTPAIDNPAAVTATLPQAMVVDWVRYYTNKDSVDATWKPDPALPVVLNAETVEGSKPLADTNQSVDTWALTCTLSEDTTTFTEGSKSWKISVGTIGWMGLGISSLYGADLRNCKDGKIQFDIKTTSTGKYRFGFKTGSIMECWIPLDASIGYIADGQWHRVTVSLSKFIQLYPYLDLRFVSQLFMFSSVGASVPGDAFYIDNLVWLPSEQNTSSISSKISSSSRSSVSSVVVSSIRSSVSSSSRISSLSSSSKSGDTVILSSSSVSSLSTITAGVDQSVQNSPVIWFKTPFTSAYVDVHYRVNNASQQNFRMIYNSAKGRWEKGITGTKAGDVVTADFTYEKSGAQFELYNFVNATIGSVVSSASTSSLSSLSSTVSSTQSYGTGLDNSAGNNTLWFKPSWNSAYVDVHYVIAGSSQQNVRMTFNSAKGRWERALGSLTPGTTVKVWYTYEKNGAQFDTTPINYTIQGTSSSSSPASSSSSAASSASSQWQSGAQSTGADSMRIWFKPSWTSLYVDVHVKVNGGITQNFRMDYSAASYEWSKSISGLLPGDSVSYSFTYEKSGLQYDSSIFTVIK